MKQLKAFIIVKSINNLLLKKLGKNIFIKKILLLLLLLHKNIFCILLLIIFVIIKSIIPLNVFRNSCSVLCNSHYLQQLLLHLH